MRWLANHQKIGLVARFGSVPDWSRICIESYEAEVRGSIVWVGGCVCVCVCEAGVSLRRYSWIDVNVT